MEASILEKKVNLSLLAGDLILSQKITHKKSPSAKMMSSISHLYTINE